MPVIGFLHPGMANASFSSDLAAGFTQGLKESGFVGGKNLTIEYRWANGHPEKLPDLAADLIRRQTAVIFGSGNAAALAARAATNTVPVVFAVGGDPVKLGLVSSLNRRGGNATGVSFISSSAVAISIQMLHEAAPGRNIIAALVNPTNPNSEPDTREAERAADTLGLPLQIFQATNAKEIDAAFGSMVKLRSAALYINGDPLFTNSLERLVGLSTTNSIPALYDLREFVAAGGLMSYGASIFDAHRIGGSMPPASSREKGRRICQYSSLSVSS